MPGRKASSQERALKRGEFGFMSIFKRAGQRVLMRQAAIELVAVLSAIAFIFLCIRNLGGTEASLFELAGSAAAIAILHSAIHAALNGYSASWRFFSLSDARTASFSAGVATAVVAAAMFPLVPLTGWLLVGVSAILGAFFPRLLVRLANSHGLLDGSGSRRKTAENDENRKKRQNLLMIGFGDQICRVA